ncbi:hypothetical protein J493_3629 [Acinetobacter baumannii 653020]|nr:hypothetical protein J493_3629 [Acinetobacter baumannii 653020]
MSEALSNLPSFSITCPSSSPPTQIFILFTSFSSDWSIAQNKKAHHLMSF